jgi:Cu/Ag efflux protein CusF
MTDDMRDTDDTRDTDGMRDEIANEPRVPGRNRLVAWATLGVLGAALAGGGIYAATAGGGSGSPSVATSAVLAAASGSATPAPSALPHDRDGRRGPGPGFGGRLGGPGGIGGIGGMGLGQLLHGEATVATANGGTEIVDTQTGTISGIDTAKKTITVTSSDKVSFTYVVDANTHLVDFALATPKNATLSDLKSGDTVRVMAVRTGDTRTAKSVLDGLPKRGAGVPGGPGHLRPLPSPSATAATTTASSA